MGLPQDKKKLTTFKFQYDNTLRFNNCYCKSINIMI